MRLAGVTAACAVTLAVTTACGGSDPPAQVPSAQALAKKLGCRTDGPDMSGVPLRYARQDISLSVSVACPADFIVTFSSVSNRDKWLDAYNAMSRQGAVYMVTGHLWAVDEPPAFTSPPNTRMIEHRLGGQPWTGGT
jgi:hypothetical protein